MKPDAENKHKLSALKAAAANGYFELVKKLVGNGADFAKAMPWAAGHGQKQILDYMLEKNPGQIALNKALDVAAGSKHPDILKILLDKGADVNFVDKDEGTTALIEAAKAPSIEEARLFLSKGANVNLKGDDDQPSALFVAASRFNADLVDLLLANGADVNVRNEYGSTPLHEAIRAGNFRDDEKEQQQQRLRIVQSLLSKGADLTGRAKWMESWQTPLLLAIKFDKPHIALLLIEQGADVNDKSGDPSSGSSSFTSLMQAAEKGMPDVIKALLAKGAEVNDRNEEGDSALLIAAKSPGGKEILPILLANGADASVVNNRGRTVLMNTAGSSWYIGEDTIRSLIKGGAKINATDINGWTALMYTARSNYESKDVAEQLLYHGADPAMTNDEGENASSIAAKEGYKKLANFLNQRHQSRRKAEGP
jgi:ankyrin repeat protein